MATQAGTDIDASDLDSGSGGMEQHVSYKMNAANPCQRNEDVQLKMDSAMSACQREELNSNCDQNITSDELNANICDRTHDCGDREPVSDQGIEPDFSDQAMCSLDCDRFDNVPLHLQDLPPEIFLKICSYLHAKFVLCTLTRVCKQFCDLLMDDATWKIRIAKRCLKRYPAVPVENFNWKRACMEREEQMRLWSDPEKTMDHFQLSDGISAPVDVVHLMNGGTLLASGSRDKFLNLWDLEKLDSNVPSSTKDARIVSKMNAHMGWIWSITSQNHILATASWDTYIKFWDLGAGCDEIRSIKCKSAILSTAYAKDVLVAGSYDKFMYIVDPRAASIVKRVRHHRRPVLCVEADDNYIISGSEDQTISVYDRRADLLLKTLHFDHFPMCMDYKMNQLLVGDKGGRLHLVDASEMKFDLVKTYDSGHTGKLTGVLYNYGSIITSSTDRMIKVFEPCLNPESIYTIKSHDAEVARISWQNDVLASAGSDICVGIWRPKSDTCMDN